MSAAPGFTPKELREGADYVVENEDTATAANMLRTAADSLEAVSAWLESEDGAARHENELRLTAEHRASKAEAELAAATRQRDSWEREALLNEEELLLHRIAAAILVGTLTSDKPETLAWAQDSAARQPADVASQTRLIVADVRLYDEGRAGEISEQLQKIRAALSGATTGEASR
jgi:hypothetical protein